ncbi:MAG: DUF969 domain-containing protein [Lacunisphaera sp.]|nr:DUF969 domain-containing protein [Lacunisphaera sp.]
MIKLIGILVVAVGFALRFNTLLVVMVAGISTGLVAGMSFHEIMELFGKYFVENRYMTLTVVFMLPVVGVLERYGLRERAEALVRRARAATAGRVLIFYTAVRQISIAFGVNIGGHAGMVRPLVAPMAEAAAKLQIAKAALPAEGAARAKQGKLPEKTIELIRAHAAAAENVGNFFGEDTVFAVGAVLLIQGTLQAQGFEVGLWALSLWGIPTALVAFACLVWRACALDRRLARESAAEPKQEGGR